MVPDDVGPFLAHHSLRVGLALAYRGNYPFLRGLVEARPAALERACQDLSQKRKKEAKELGAIVQKELGDLGLKQAVFRCQVNSLTDPTTTGLVFHKGDTVYFVLAQFKAPVGVVLDAAKMKADVVALAKTVAAKL